MLEGELDRYLTKGFVRKLISAICIITRDLFSFELNCDIINGDATDEKILKLSGYRKSFLIKRD